MMNFVISFAISLGITIGVVAQTPTSTPPPPSSTPVPQQPVQTSGQPQRGPAIRRFPQNFPLNPVSESDQLSARVIRLQWMIAPMYRKPGNKETASLSPSAAVLVRYGSLIRSEGSGVIRLAPDRGCVFSERIVNVRDECLKYSFPGAGNSYSFRIDGYRLRHLADLTFTNDKLRITGVFMHGIAVELGDVPIETAGLMTPGMKFLTDFQPSTSSNDVVDVDNALARGIKSENFVYSKEVDPTMDRTYAIRSVAYRGKVVRTAGGVRYNELDYDKRRDVIVVFRVVEMDKDGITLAWRMLADIEPPRIKMPKPEEKRNKAISEDEAN